jgi:MoaA/NifB/PqqE/SkfB family radical SAM enzyme
MFKTLAALLTENSSLARCLAEPGVFGGKLDSKKKTRLFKSLVNYVEFEPHAFCNRTCVFCPNSTLDRKTNKQVFDRALHRKVLNELAEIDYAGTIAYSRYSEPLAREEIFDYIAEARSLSPRACLKIITNGDYLSHERILRLQSLGLNYLAISIYLPEGVAWSSQAALEQIEKFSKRVSMGFQVRRKARASVFVDFLKEASGMKMDARCHDFGQGKEGVDRGMSVAWLSPACFVRKNPCLFVFRNFTMDFNGNVMPCCNLRSDHPRHAPCVLGNVAQETIFDIYAGLSFAQWRHALSGFAPKSAPCKHCKDAPMNSVPDRLLTAAWNLFSS